MMSWNLTDDLEGWVSLTLRGPAGQTEIEALVDTGFSGFLALSPGQIAELDLEWSRYESAELADGEVVVASLYEAESLWDGDWRTLEIAALGTTPLLGMQLLRNYRLLVDVVEGGQLTITPLNEVQ